MGWAALSALWYSRPHLFNVFQSLCDSLLPLCCPWAVPAGLLMQQSWNLQQGAPLPAASPSTIQRFSFSLTGPSLQSTNTQCRELCDTQKWMRDCAAEVPQANTTPDCCPSCLLVSEKGERYNDPIIKARELLTGNSKLRLHKAYWKNCPVTRAKSIVSIHGIGKRQV